jgi:hypothetical protein
VEPLNGRQKIRFQRSKGRLGRASPSNHHDVPPGACGLSSDVPTKDFPQAPLGSVPLNGTTEASRGDQAQSVAPEGVGVPQYGDVACAHPPAALLNGSKLLAGTQPDRGAKPDRHMGGASRALRAGGPETD